MDHNEAEFSLSDLIPLLDALCQLIPDEYSSGLSFAGWADVMTALTKFLPIAIQAARILKAVADRVMESTPEERAEIGRRLGAISDILQRIAEREPKYSETTSLPMLPPPTRVGRNDSRRGYTSTAISLSLTPI